MFTNMHMNIHISMNDKKGSQMASVFVVYYQIDKW